MSTSNNTSNNSNNTFLLLSIRAKVTFDGSNFNDWIRNTQMALHFEDKEYVLDKELNKINESKSTPEEIAEYKAHCKDATKVTCNMVATMTLELHQF